jgi:hypothetical protein
MSIASKVSLIHTGLQPGGMALTLLETVLTVSLAKRAKPLKRFSGKRNFSHRAKARCE